MLTPADDYPLHQTPEPMAYAGSDRNFYDRFFFNGYSADGAVFFAAALGVYPQLNIMDASFALSYEGRQYNLRASKEMLGDRLALSVGPLTVEIVKPMRETRITLADNEGGLSGSLTAQARHEAIEEPRFTRRQGTRMMMDLTRATQNIDWQGTLDLRGEKIDVSGCRGTRDRSWGIRQIGMAEPQAPVPPAPQQFYWLWTPSNFDDAAFFCHSNDDGDGVPWNRKAVFDDFANGSRLEMTQLDFTTAYHAARAASLIWCCKATGSKPALPRQAIFFTCKVLAIFIPNGTMACIMAPYAWLLTRLICAPPKPPSKPAKWKICIFKACRILSLR